MTDLVTSNMALLALAPQGVAQLRSLIMDLAVRGRLIAQQEDDAPAVEVIACIDRAKRASLGKVELARLDALASAPIDEQPFELPANWLWRRLGAIGVVASSSRVHQKDWTTEGIPFYRTREIVQLSNKGSVTPDLFISEALFDELVARSPGPVAGDIMITGVGTIGVPYVVRPSDKFYFKDASVLIFKNYFGLSPDYLALFFKSPLWRETIHKESMGTTVHTLTIGRANEVLVPIPPLAEQRRIVAKVAELMALCDRLEARQQDAEAAHARLVQALLDSLTQARDADEFQACWQRVTEQFPVLFTTTASINGLWSAVLCLAAEGKLVAPSERVAHLPIGELLLGDTLNGCSYKPSDTPVGTPILRISAGTGSDDFIVDETDHKWVEVSAAEREKFRLQPNDLLACRFNGNLHYVGAFALYDGSSGVEQIFPDKLIRFRVDDKRALPGYLRFVMNALPARQQIESFCATTVGNIGISATNLKTVKVRVPSLDEQERIVAKVTELLTLCGELKARIAAARAKHAQLAEALVAQAVA